MTCALRINVLCLVTTNEKVLSDCHLDRSAFVFKLLPGKLKYICDHICDQADNNSNYCSMCCA